MTFAFGSFTLGAAMLYSAFKNQPLVSLILGKGGESLQSQHEAALRDVPADNGEVNPKGASVDGPVSKGAVDTYGGFKIPKGTRKSVAVKLAKGAAKIAWMSGRFPYSWGGGHDKGFCVPSGAGEHGGPGFDCSGCWSCVLGIMGIISSPLTSGSMASAFVSGPGKYITLWANEEHVFGTFLGVPFATGSAKEALRGGPAIGNTDDKSGFKECHPKGW